MKGTCRGRKRRGLQGENKGLPLLEKIVNYKKKKNNKKKKQERVAKVDRQTSL